MLGLIDDRVGAVAKAGMVARSRKKATHKIPNLKPQIPKKSETPNIKLEARTVDLQDPAIYF
jgi:hypothetical protein